MEDIYDDLENFNDVNLVNELRAENEELKQKLGKYADTMETLQKSILQDFDNISAEFKVLETNYSSLLKSARAEIKRKTDMIKNLNIEKDLLVLKQFRDKPQHRQKLMNACKMKAEGIVKKKTMAPNTADGLKQRDEFNRKECERPPSEDSSTATEKSNKSLSTKDRSTVRNTKKENVTHHNEAFPHQKENFRDDRLQMGSVADKRISTLSSQQFLKFSSDEEFEDMYSALEPKTTTQGSSFGEEPHKGQKRVRVEQQHARVYNEPPGPQDKRLNYTDTPRDRFSNNRNRFYENERNVTREKYDLPHPHRNKYSPDRVRYSKREFGDDRFLQQYDRHRWLDSAPGDKHQQRRRERRPYPDRGRGDQNPDMDRNNHSDSYTSKHKLASSTQIHGEYDQPPVKRFRRDQFPSTYTDEDRRRNDRQYPHEYRPEMREFYPPSQISDELVNSIYADIDKPTSDAMLPGDGNVIKANQDVCQDMEIERDIAGKSDHQSTKKYTVNDNSRSKHLEEKFNEGDKAHTISKYKIPLKGDKVNTDGLPELSKTKSNKVDTSIHSGESGRTSLPHKDLPSASECSKISEVPKTVETSKLTNTADLEGFPAKASKIGKNETEVNASFDRALEQKLSSIRNIVEGDLELSDETNDGTQGQLNVKEQPDSKRKHKIKKKSRRDSSKDKHSDLKVNTRNSRSKTDRDKEVKAKNKFSELFGDSSSLISPEDLELAPTAAPAQRADAYTAVCEDAQDGIQLQTKRNDVLTLGAKKEISRTDPNGICPQTDSSHLEEKNKTKDTKDSKSRAHRKHRKSGVSLSMDDVQDLNEINLPNIVNPSTTDNVKLNLQSEIEKNPFSERPKKQLDRNKPEKKIKGDVLEMPKVKTTAPYKKCKDILKITKLDKKTRVDDVATVVIPGVNTAVSSKKSKEISSVNNPDQIIPKSDVVETNLMLKVKAIASSEESNEILNVSIPNSKAESNVVETHLTPKAKAVVSIDKFKEIFNTTKSDKKTPSDVVETHLIPKVNKPEEKTECNVVETHLTPELRTVASPEISKEILNKSELVKKTESDVVETQLMPEVKAVASSESSKEIFNVTKTDTNNDPTVGTPLMAEVKTAVLHEKSKETCNLAKTEKKTKGALKCSEKNKDHAKSNRKPKSNEDKILTSSVVAKESYITKNRNITEPNKPIIENSNKENVSCQEVSEGTMNSDLPNIFEDTLVPSETTSVDKSKTNEENLTVNMAPKETINNTRIDDTPNLVAVTEDPGLVNTVVISSGIQPPVANVPQVNATESQYTPLKALATSTPTRELSAINTLSETKPYINPLTSSVNIKTANENPVSKYDETDVPDVRIYCHRRRRKLVK